jgi:hypothetical protein
MIHEHAELAVVRTVVQHGYAPDLDESLVSHPGVRLRGGTLRTGVPQQASVCTKS